MENVFFDNGIYENADDYIIGSFCRAIDSRTITTEEVRFNVEQRIKKLIKEYVDDSLDGASDRTSQYAETLAKITFLIQQYLTVSEAEMADVTSATDFVDIIMNSPEMNSWLWDMKQRVNARNQGFIEEKSKPVNPDIPTMARPVEIIDAGAVAGSSDEILESEAQTFYESTTFVELLEALKNLND